MKVTTFKNIKDILNDVPDEILDNLYFGLGEGAEDRITIISPEGEDGYPEIFDRIDKDFPELKEVFKLIENIHKFQKILDSNEQWEDLTKLEELEEELWESGLSSKTYFKEKIDELRELVEEKLKKQKRKGIK